MAMIENQGSPSRNGITQKFAELPAQPLKDSDLHIWRASLSGSPDELSYFDSLLSMDEKARAERFYFERDRNRYVFGRGILRTLLGNYLRQEASKITFVYGLYGKPAIGSMHSNKTLQFNLAHSNEWAVYVFGWDQPLGIDLEHIRPMPDVDDLAERVFSASESALIHSLFDDQKWETFFTIWTCKEAFLKARGSGLTIPLDQFEVSPNANGDMKLTSISGNSTLAARWRLETFKPMADYQSAIAVENHTGKIIFHRFDDQI
jgi:4'-phosphopantetheinyl transferase